jgi:hypothetical protein
MGASGAIKLPQGQTEASERLFDNKLNELTCRELVLLPPFEKWWNPPRLTRPRASQGQPRGSGGYLPRVNKVAPSGGLHLPTIQ